MSEKKEKYTVVVLAAGKGTRMGGCLLYTSPSPRDA